MVSRRGVDVVPFSDDHFDDFGTLLRSQPESTGCWCMWFVRRVADYHADGDAGNRAVFTELVRSSSSPVGLLAFRGREAIGWCAVGPRRGTSEC